MPNQEDRHLWTEINGYHIIEYITSGDFGKTYRAQHCETSRIVVMKLLPKESLSKATSELFCIDESLLMKLSHPHLLSILDLKLCRDIPIDLNCQPHIVTRHASNGSLRRNIQKRRGKPFSVEETLSILIPIGQALQYLHEKDIIHRGIQPECILFDEQYNPQLSGLDLAIIDDSYSSWTLGTKHYRAPEQFNGIVNKQSDQFALACIAYELLTGQHPFFPDLTLEPSQKNLSIYTFPRDFSPEMAEHIKVALTKALSMNPNDRYPSIIDFITALSTSAVPPSEQQGKMPEMGKRFLSGSDLTLITDIVETVVDSMSAAGMQNLLRGKLPNDQISRINFRDGSRNIADNIINGLERAGTLNPPHYHALGAFLKDLIEDDRVSYDATMNILAVLSRYTLVTDRQQIAKLGAQSQVATFSSEEEG